MMIDKSPYNVQILIFLIDCCNWGKEFNMWHLIMMEDKYFISYSWQHWKLLRIVVCISRQEITGGLNQMAIRLFYFKRSWSGKTSICTRLTWKDTEIALALSVTADHRRNQLNQWLSGKSPSSHQLQTRASQEIIGSSRNINRPSIHDLWQPDL